MLVVKFFGKSGFAVKNAIQDQIGGDPNMNFDPSKGKVKAPWIAWGPYYWANGLNPRATVWCGRVRIWIRTGRIRRIRWDASRWQRSC